MKLKFADFLFKGGIHPPGSKSLASACPLRELPLPKLVTVSMSQHLGAPAVPVVAPGDKVIADQLIATAKGPISAPVHSPVCGTVKAIVNAPTPNGRTATAIVIEPDPEATERDTTLTPFADWKNAAPADLLDRVRAAGIIGMGGAGFPTAVKLSPPSDKPIDTLIVNGAECEPYLNSDNRMMIERAEGIWTGVQIISRILGVGKIRVAIEDNKPKAIDAMASVMKFAEGDVEIVKLKVLYPQGSEKQQIFSVTGRTVPMGKLPMDVGCVVENVSTAYAVYDAVVNGRPLTRRAITVSGDAVALPSNFIAPIGTSYADLLAACGGNSKDVVRIISGGPMMGFALPSADIAMTKTSSGILFFSGECLSQYSSSPCINCGRCVEACPLRLMPNEISQAVEADDIALAEELNVMDCFECGTCSYVCPAHRPLVQHHRRAKAIIAAKRRAAKK